MPGRGSSSFSRMTRSMEELIRTFAASPFSVISTLRFAYHTMLATKSRKAQPTTMIA